METCSLASLFSSSSSTTAVAVLSCCTERLRDFTSIRQLMLRNRLFHTQLRTTVSCTRALCTFQHCSNTFDCCSVIPPSRFFVCDTRNVSVCFWSMSLLAMLWTHSMHQIVMRNCFQYNEWWYKVVLLTVTNQQWCKLSLQNSQYNHTQNLAGTQPGGVLRHMITDYRSSQ